MTVSATELAGYLDELLDSRATPDYPNALNGLQLAHRGPVRTIGAAVDFSLRTIEEAVRADVNFLLVHHGIFWGGLRAVVGPTYNRLRLLFDHDIAVYASHLPLDAHASLGNAVLLARELDLVPSIPFARFAGVAIGVAGECVVETTELFARVDRFAHAFGGAALASTFDATRVTRRWAICTGAGASSETLSEAQTLHVDTLIVGEGPHHTAVEAPELDLVIMYGGHYATETLGVRAAAEHLSRRFGIPWQFLSAPTGL